MKLSLEVLNDVNGKPKAVQLSLTDWEKLMLKLKKYEQILKIKSDLTEAFAEANLLKKSKEKKQTLTDFLNEL
jgi:PHD/YefM family antitoxin component YafN of YafNO toxin-antitoxin module